jgi:superfamily I DNA/RNA helicase
MDERRLFYVALTRAKEKIYVLSDNRHITELIKEI